MKKHLSIEHLADHDLIKLMNRGDDRGFEVLYQRHRDWAFRMAHRITGNSHAADDVLQDTFCYFISKFPGFELTCELRTFLYPVIRNLSLNFIKKSRRMEGGPQAELCIEQLEAPTAETTQSQDMMSFTDGLSPDHREVLLLRYVDGMSVPEISALIEIPLGTVKSRLHLALAALRKSPAVQEFFALSER